MGPRASILPVLVGVGTGCPRRSEEAKPIAKPAVDAAVQVSPAPPVSAPDAGDAATAGGIFTQRDYRGPLGDKTSVEMFVERQNDHLYGSYRYVTVGKDLDLSGLVQSDGTMILNEKVDGKVTGKIALRAEAEGALVGTWSDPAGAKTFPLRLVPRGVHEADRATSSARATSR